MLDPQLKQEWLDRVSTPYKDTYSKGITHHHTDLYKAPDDIKADYDINMAAALSGKEFFWNLHTTLKDNKQFIIELIASGYSTSRNIYSYMSYKLQDDVELFESLLERKDHFDWGISEQILSNKDLILKLLKQYDIFNKLKNKYNLDKDILSIQLERDPSRYLYLKPRMYNYFSARKEILVKILSKSHDAHRLYKHMPAKMQENLDVIHALLKSSPSSINYLPQEIIDDKSFMSYAIKTYSCNVPQNSTLLVDKDILKSCIEIDPYRLIRYEALRDDIELIDFAFSRCKDISLLSKKSLKNKELVIKFLVADSNNCKKLLKTNNDYYEDIDVMTICIEADHTLSEYAKNLQYSQSLSYLATVKSQDLSLADIHTLNNRNFVLTLLDSPTNIKNALSHSSFFNLYNNDEEICKKMIRNTPTAIAHFQFKKDKDMIAYALEHGLQSMEHIDCSLWSDKELALTFIAKNEINYTILPLELINDKDIIHAVLSRASYYNIVMSKSIYARDYDFHVKLVKENPNTYLPMQKSSLFQDDPNLLLIYIESCEEHNINAVVSQIQFIKYGTENIHDLKAMLLHKKIEESLSISDKTVQSKIKI